MEESEDRSTFMSRVRDMHAFAVDLDEYRCGKKLVDPLFVLCNM